MGSSEEKYKLFELYEVVKEYYPIGLDINRNPYYRNYPGQLKLGKLLEDKIHSPKNFKRVWKKFEQKVYKEAKHELIGTTYGQLPSFSAYFEIDRIEIDDSIRIKELHFYVSLLGNYYTIVGQDRTEIRRDNRLFHNINFITVSPQNEYGDLFNKIMNLIESEFESYKFIPYFLYATKIVGLYTPDRMNGDGKIFDALFGSSHNFLDSQAIGDHFFHDSIWKNENYDSNNDSHWIVYTSSGDH